MADDATDVPGVTTRTLRGTTFLLVSMKDAFRTNLPEIAIGDFADFVKLPAEEVFKQLLQNPRNVDTVKWLWKSQVKTPLTDLRKARAQLGKLGHKPVIVDQFASHASLDFLGWGLSRTQIPVVVVSQSDGFKEVMRAASEKRATQFRVALTQPVFDALNAKVKEIDKLVIDLNLAIGGLTAFAKTNAREFQILMALQSLLLALINHPKNPNEAQSHKDDLEIVRKRVKNLADFARKDLMTDPPNSS
ncbi:MAG TPA: hypothetical protein VFF73_19640, partial [Planctomycetota bacterium]|nr:hypothetical protein [Planctomycetota bacterium]